MMSARVRWLGVGSSICLLVGLLWLGGRDETPAPPARGPSLPASTKSEPRAPQGDRGGPRSPEEGVQVSLARSSNSELPRSRAEELTALAASSDDPAVIEATFAELRTVYAARSTRKPAPDAALERVLVKHLGASRDSTLRAALETARVALVTEPPSEAVVSAIARASASDQALPRRAAALEALNFLREGRRGAAVLGAFEQGLDAEEPELVSLALAALSQSRASVERAGDATRAELAERVLSLLGHGDPGVRGNALWVLSELPSLVPGLRRYEAGQRALLDRVAYVVAQGAALLARCGRAAAIHALIREVGDVRAARYELARRGLDGSPGVLVHELPGRKRVGEAALFAVRSLGETIPGGEPFTLTLRDRYTDDALVRENAESARAWYRRNQALIPQVP